MQFRRITPSDQSQVANFCIEGMRVHLYPMRLSLSKVQATVEHFMHSRSDFHLAAFDGPRVVGGIAAAVSESPWFERCDCTVVMFRAVVPGVGRKLLAAFRDWVDNDMRIRRAFVPLEFDADKRMPRLLARYGFGGTQTVCTHMKE